MEIGTRIRRQRDKKKMSQQVLADIVGVAQSTIHNWESELTSPDSYEIKKLAEAFDIPVSQLLMETTTLKVTQQNRDKSHSNNQPIHATAQPTIYQDLLSAQKELIQVQKARILSLEEENERLKSQLRD